MNETKKGNKMTKTQMTKLIKAVEERIARENAITGNKQKLVPAKNQEELRYPDAPTWNTEGKGYYDFHIVYWTSRDANTNKGGRVSMPSKDRWATFQITHLITDDNGTKTKVEKNNTVTVVDNVIKIHTVVKVGYYNHEIGTHYSLKDCYKAFTKAILGKA